MTPPADLPSPWEVPPPVLFNTWKHHAGALRRRIQETVREREPALAELARRLAVVGTDLMDLYTGSLPPAAIAVAILDQLRADQHLDPDAYHDWLAANGGYAVLTLAPDGSRWVLRRGEDAGRYVHLHPGRWSPQTRRVRANVLKTAVAVLAWTGLHGGDPLSRPLVNRVRGELLGLSPVGNDLSDRQGLGGVVALLRAATAELQA